METVEVTKYRLNITPDRTVDAELKAVPLKLLKLDPRNIRFKHISQALTDADMEKIIWDEPDTRELYNEIKFSQGLSEAPIVDSDCFTREGNRRVVCLRKLLEPVAKGKTTVPREKIDPVQCIVLPKETPESDIAIYLTRVHVSGKKEWRALNQAAQVYELYNTHRFSYEQIRESVSISKQTAINMEQAYKKTLEYHTKYPDDKEWLGRYSYFYELFKPKSLREWAEKEGNVEQFGKWIAEGKIAKGEEVRTLPKIINDPEAYEALVSKGNKGAIDILSEKDPTADSMTYRRLQTALTAIQNFPRNELLNTVKNKSKLQLLEKLHTELEGLIKDIKSAAKGS